MAESYQGGGDAVLNSFYNNLRQDQFRFFQNLQLKAFNRQRRAEDYNKQIQGELAKINPDGIDAKNIPGYFRRYNEIKDIAQQIDNADTPEKKATLRAEFSSKLQDINLFTNGVKDLNKNIYSNSGNAADADEEGQKYYQKFINTPYDELPEKQFDPLKLRPRVNFKEANNIIDNIFNTAVDAGEQTIQGGRRLTIAGKGGQELVTKREASLENVLTKLEGAYNFNTDVRRLIDSTYPTLGTPNERLQQFIQDNPDNLRKVTRTFEPGYKPDSDGSRPANLVVNPALQIPLGDKTVTVQGVVNMTPRRQTITGADAYDTDSNEYIKIGNVQDGVSIGQTGWYPFLKQDVKGLNKSGVAVSTIKGGSMVQSDFAESNPNLVVWRLGALGAYDEKSPSGGASRQKNVFIEEKNVPRSTKEIKTAFEESAKFNPNTTRRTENKSVSSQKSNVPTATRAEWKKAGWSDSDITEGLRTGVIKVK
jgi:hypothetical protein